MNVGTVIKDRETNRVTTLTNENSQSDVESISKDPAYVTVTAGITRNLENYNSAKISVSIHYPCDPAKVDEVYPLLKEWVDERVTAESKEIDDYLKSKKE